MIYLVITGEIADSSLSIEGLYEGPSGLNLLEARKEWKENVTPTLKPQGILPRVHKEQLEESLHKFLVEKFSLKTIEHEVLEIVDDTLWNTLPQKTGIEITKEQPNA